MREREKSTDKMRKYKCIGENRLKRYNKVIENSNVMINRNEKRNGQT